MLLSEPEELLARRAFPAEFCNRRDKLVKTKKPVSEPRLIHTATLDPVATAGLPSTYRSNAVDRTALARCAGQIGDCHATTLDGPLSRRLPLGCTWAVLDSMPTLLPLLPA
jgi:hypothetical protein